MRNDPYGYRLSPGATAKGQRREMLRHFGDRHPVYYDCGICGSYHPDGYRGDCRNDLYRINDPDELHGADGWTAIDMEDAN